MQGFLVFWEFTFTYYYFLFVKVGTTLLVDIHNNQVKLRAYLKNANLLHIMRQWQE